MKSSWVAAAVSKSSGVKSLFWTMFGSDGSAIVNFLAASASFSLSPASLHLVRICFSSLAIFSLPANPKSSVQALKIDFRPYIVEGQAFDKLATVVSKNYLQQLFPLPSASFLLASSNPVSAASFALAALEATMSDARAPMSSTFRLQPFLNESGGTQLHPLPSHWLRFHDGAIGSVDEIYHTVSTCMNRNHITDTCLYRGNWGSCSAKPRHKSSGKYRKPIHKVEYLPLRMTRTCCQERIPEKWPRNLEETYFKITFKRQTLYKNMFLLGNTVATSSLAWISAEPKFTRSGSVQELGLQRFIPFAGAIRPIMTSSALPG